MYYIHINLNAHTYLHSQSVIHLVLIQHIKVSTNYTGTCIALDSISVRHIQHEVLCTVTKPTMITDNKLTELSQATNTDYMCTTSRSVVMTCCTPQ